MDKPTRVLQVVAKMNRAGTETMLMNYYRHVDRKKVQFDFAVCTEEKCDYEEEILSMGGHIYRYPRYKGWNHFQYVAWWKRFFLRHPEYHIVHGHIGSTAAIYLKIAKQFKCFTIAHSHGTKEPLSLRSLMYQIYSYPTRFIADQFFGCSMQALEDRYGKKVAHGSKAKVLNNAIDSGLYAYNKKKRDNIRTELRIADNTFVIGTIGRLSPPKNPFMVVNILAELKKRNLDFKFLWVGVGEMKRDIEKAIIQKNLTSNVVMLGLRDDIPCILQAFDVFILPSVWEGLGIVAIEAQAAGLPTLCSDQVPIEAKVTNLCEFISLSSISLWADSIIMCLSKMRLNTTDLIKNNGYDIYDNAVWLQDFYNGAIE